MTRLFIRHETVYDYDRPVAFAPWRLVMRPLGSHALRVVEARLTLSPPGVTRWTHDPYGNSICWFEPHGEADRLSVVNDLTIDRFPNPMIIPEIDDPRSQFPLVYDPLDQEVLAPFMRPSVKRSDRAFLRWLRGLPITRGALALDVLHTLNAKINSDFIYEAREAEGVMTPNELVSQGSGACRDYAWLMIEAMRRLGFAARFVTGYLNSPGAANQGAGATHAWVEAYLPQLGWVEFDPTNALAESDDLIRVAATRTPQEAAPMRGAIIGRANGRMSVTVTVSETDEDGGAP